MRTESRELLAVGVFGSRSLIGDRIEVLLRRGRTFSPRVSAAGVAASAAVSSALIVAGSLAPRWIAFAQPAPKPSFEVASVKPADSSDKPGFLQAAPGRLTLNSVTVKMLIQQAWAISGYRIYGGPSWLDSTRFNIAAKASDGTGNLTLDQMRPMLQTLLTDRFHLALHPETKELPLYRLVVSRGGKKFGESAVSGEPQSRMGTGRITDDKASLDTLASQLGQQLGRFVLNRTGLQGYFDFHVQWTPDPGQNLGGDSDTPPPAGADGPSIFTALQEQLGLKLESGKGPVEVLVVDRAEKPDAN
jgi:bla regulator protein blaR1